MRDRRPEFLGRTHQTVGGLNADVQIGNFVLGASGFRSESRTDQFGNSALGILSGRTVTSTDMALLRLMLISGSYNFGVYGGYADADVNESRSTFTFSRSVQTYTGGLIAGANFEMGKIFARPSLRLQLNQIESGGYTTSDGLLTVAADTDRQLTGQVGADVGVILTFGDVVVLPGIRAAYVRDFDQIKGAIDQDYFDLGAFISIAKGNFTLGAEASIWVGNDDADSRSVRAFASVRF